MLCLCPNDHVWFDYGAIWLDDQLQVVDAELGKVGHRIHLDPRHQLDLAHVRYHCSLWEGQRDLM